MDSVGGAEKKEVSAKSLEALKRLGHGDLKLSEHESEYLYSNFP